MKKNKITLNIGIPASGKTTWSLNQVKNNPKTIRISRDDYRFMMKDAPILDTKMESVLTKMVYNDIATLAGAGYDLIIDQTNCNKKHLLAMVDYCQQYGDVHFQIFDVSLEKAIDRDKNREKSVGEDVIKRMHKGFLSIFDSNFDFSVRKKKERFVSNYQINENDKQKAFIFDVDGTLAHNLNVRGYFDWDKVDRDAYDELVGQMAKDLKSLGYYIIIVTGRDGSAGKLTKEWLSFYGVPFDEFFIRPTGDYRKDNVIKKEIYEQNIKPFYNVMGVFDDRDQVVSFWRKEANLKTYQVEYGNF